VISFDTETDPFAPGEQFPRAVCGQFAKGDRAVIVSEADLLKLARDVLSSGDLVIGHTIAFDWAVCSRYDHRFLGEVFQAYDDGRILDIVVRQKLIDIAKGSGTKRAYDLSSLSQRYGFGTLDKGEDGFRTRFGELRHVPIDSWPRRAKDYAMTDALIVPRIFAAQEAISNSLGGVLEDQHRQSAHAFWLKLASGWGIMTDERGVAEFERVTRAEHRRVGDKLRACGWLRPDKILKSGPRKGQVEPGTRHEALVRAEVTAATSHMSLKEKEIAGYVTDSGGPSINKKALRDLADLALAKADEQGADRARLLARADRFVAYADFASLVKTISTDIPLLSQRPIHTFFDSLKETGRIGSSKPNITNLPRREGVRECFVPRAGCCFVSADYGGIELYTWAEVCEALLRQSTLADELRAGLDPHLVVASDILSKPYDWCLMNKKAVDLERQTGKVLNFGAPGGVGAARLAFAAKNQYGVDLTVERAGELRSLWWAKRAEMRPYSRMVNDIVRRDNPILQLYAGRYRGGCSYTEACNSFFQGLASDIAKSAGFLVAWACYAQPDSPMYGCRIVNFVHDEIILEVPLGRQHEAAAELERLMTVAASRWLKKVPTPKIETDAMMRWSKKVIRLEHNGGLVPWTRTAKVPGFSEHYGFVNGRETLIKRVAA
jgi:DNA polymerase-1